MQFVQSHEAQDAVLNLVWIFLIKMLFKHFYVTNCISNKTKWFFCLCQSFYTIIFVMCLFVTKITDKLQVLATCYRRNIVWPYTVVLTVLTSPPHVKP